MVKRNALRRPAVAVVPLAMLVAIPTMSVEASTVKAHAVAPRIPLGMQGHYLCYSTPATSTSFPTRPAAVQLFDHWIHPYYFAKVGTAGGFCNAATVRIGSVTETPPNPLVHEVCFQIFPSGTHSPFTSMVTTEFGTVKLLIGATKNLCLQSLAKLTGPPIGVVPTKTTYTCYAASYATSATYSINLTGLKDNFFGTSYMFPQAILGLHSVCMPTTIKWTGHGPYAPAAGTPSLVCLYPKDPPNTKPTVYVKNMFGQGKFTGIPLHMPVYKTDLCVKGTVFP
jgi:hypothetical protein